MEIKIEGLTKSYGGKIALDDISLKIDQGMFGLLGPNGAGKTTLMRILTTILNKTTGTIKINGIDIGEKRKIRSIIGYLPQEFSVYRSMTVYDAMDYLAILSEIKPKSRRRELIIELLGKVNLENNLKTKVRALSGGMKRRLGIAQALLNDPKVLIVDEPTAGLDPEERIRFRNLLSDFSRDRIVILSTHIVEDIEVTCEKLAILKRGRILYSGDVQELLKQAEGNVWTGTVSKEEFEKIINKESIISRVSEGENIRLKLLSESKPMLNAEPIKPSIEDAYMKVMGGVK